MIQLEILKSDFTLWEVEFRIFKSYDRKIFTAKQALKHFKKITGVDPFEFEDEGEDHINLSVEIQYYACDTGHGGNIINDCLIALKEDSQGIMEEADYDYSWTKLDYMNFLNSEEINYALEISSFGDIQYGNKILRGKCLGLVWNDCSCDNCT